MTTNKINSSIFRPQLATLILIGIVVLAAGIALLWAAGVGMIGDLFAYLNLLQEHK